MIADPRRLPLDGDLSAPPLRPAPYAAKGFRPFFLLAAALAVVLVPAWLLVLTGTLGTAPYLGGALWHAHEMVFGFGVAVVAGFLLTAVSNWTQRETLVGAPLLALAGLWALGRVALLLPGAFPPGVPALVDLAFLPALLVALGRPIVLARNRRNAIMLVAVAALFVANVVVHLDAAGLAARGLGRAAILSALDVVVFLCLVIGGRVIPMFTRNATSGAVVATSRALDVVTLASAALLVVAGFAMPEAKVTGALAALTATLAVARAARWGTLKTAREPLLWVLHLGYAWIPIGYLLRAATAFGAPVAASLATHALSVGAVGMLTLGMMARVALGHTGRRLRVPPGIAVAFGLAFVAALVRVVGPFALPGAYTATLVVAGAFWTLAFALYLVGYARILVAPRADGRPG